MTPRDFALDVVRRLHTAGFTSLWAGGCVRDELLGLTPADYDVATDARPEAVQSLFPRTVAVGAAFGVIDVIGPRYRNGHHAVQVATFRSDGTYSDGRRPDSVTFGNAEADAARRDFTVNGLFFDPLADRLIDYVGGQADLKAKILRAIGDPAERFREDKLRLLRAVRMATRFDLTVDPATQAAAAAMASEISVVSVERIADELRKLFAHPNRGRGVRLLGEFGLARELIPELTTWPVAALDRLPPGATFTTVLACIALPLGKAGTERLARRWKLSNEEVHDAAWLVANRDRLAVARKPSDLYPILAHPLGGPLIELANALGDEVGHAESVFRTTPMDTLSPPPLITGDDLRRAGHRPGPRFKLALDAVRAAQLDGDIATADEAMEMAAKEIEQSR
jgi:poly(A) polymerase